MKARRENDHGRPRNYNRTFVVSTHALQRFRERVEKDFVGYSDYELGNILDERVKHAQRHQTVIDTKAIDAVTRVFELERRDGSIYYAVVRDMTVVTVLDADMLQVNFDNGSWKPGPMNMPFNRDSLRGLVPEVSAIKASVVVNEPMPAAVAKHIDRGLAVVASDPVADASLLLGEAMAATMEAQNEVDAITARISQLQDEAVEAIMRKEAAEKAEQDAHHALIAAVTLKTKKKDKTK